MTKEKTANSPIRSIKIDDKDVHILRNFDPQEWQLEVKQDAKNNVLTERELRLKDITWKLTNRGSLKIFLMCLLVFQNFIVFGLVTIALILGKMKDLQLVFSVLIGATLAETSSMVFFMVRWLFSDIKYDKQSIHDGR